jgi:hypothetical protein
VNWFNNMANFIPTKESVMTQDTRSLFFTHMFKHHGLPKDIVSNQDPKFTSKFWWILWKRMGVEAQDEHLILTPNRWANWEGELGYPIFFLKLCGSILTKLGGSFGVGWILLQEFRAFGNKGHTSDGQVINRAYDLGCEWATLEQCKWGSANDHTTWWKKVALVGYGQNWSSKGTKMVQGFCVQVSMWGDFEQGNKVWLNIKIGIGH